MTEGGSQLRSTGHRCRQVIAIFHNRTWEIGGRHYTAYDVEGSATIRFEDGLGGQSDVVYGPFNSIKTTDGLMWANSELFAKFINETQPWHDIKHNSYWPMMVTARRKPHFDFTTLIRSISRLEGNRSGQEGAAAGERLKK